MLNYHVHFCHQVVEEQKKKRIGRFFALNP